MANEIAARRAIWIAGLLVAAAVYAWVSRHYLAVLLVPFGDSWAHLAAIRRTIERGPFPGDLFYGEGGASPPYYSLAHIAFAWISQLSGVQPHEVWIAAPPWIAVLDLAATFLFLHRLTGDLRVAVLGAGLELLLRVPGPAWAALSFPSSIAVAPRYLCWYAYLRGRPERRIGWLIAAGVALGACFATHLYVGGLCAIGLLLLDLVLSDRRRPIPGPALLTLAIAAAIASPWFGNYVSGWLHRPAKSEAVFNLARQSWTLNLGPLPLTIIEPSLTLGALTGPLWIPVLLGLVFSVRRSRRGEATWADRFALYSALASALLVLTPLYGIAVALLGVWSPRLVLVCPFPLLFGLGITGFIDWIATAAIAAAARRAVQLAGLALMVWIGVVVYRDFRDPILTTAPFGDSLRAGGPFGDWNLAARLAEKGLEPHLILSDPDTAYDLVYLLGANVVAIPAAHDSAFVDHGPRLRAVRDFYVPGASDRELRAVLDRYGVDMVAVAPGSTYGPDNGASVPLLEHLRRSPLFADTGCCGSVQFFVYLGGKRMR